MKVKLDDQHELTSDQHCYIVMYKGKPVWYYSNIEKALKGFRNSKYKANDCKSLRCLLEHIQRVDDYIVSLLDENKELR